jgi:hypothetical protein
VAKYGPKLYTKVKIAPKNLHAIARVANSREWVEIGFNKEGEIDISYMEPNLLSYYLFCEESDGITITGKEIFLDDVIDIIKNHR